MKKTWVRYNYSSTLVSGYLDFEAKKMVIHIPDASKSGFLVRIMKHCLDIRIFSLDFEELPRYPDFLCFDIRTKNPDIEAHGLLRYPNFDASISVHSISGFFISGNRV